MYIVTVLYDSPTVQQLMNTHCHTCKPEHCSDMQKLSLQGSTCHYKTADGRTGVPTAGIPTAGQEQCKSWVYYDQTQSIGVQSALLLHMAKTINYRQIN